MINPSNFILPYDISEGRVVVLENLKEALLLKSAEGPFCVSKAAILPPIKPKDLSITSTKGSRGIIRYAKIGYLPINFRPILPLYDHIPYFQIVGEIPPNIEVPEVYVSSSIPDEKFSDIDKAVKYTLTMRRPDLAFALAYLYLIKPKKNKLWWQKSRSLKRIIWKGIPHISDMYVLTAEMQYLLVPKTSYCYKAISAWWGISGGYHNPTKRFAPIKLKELYSLMNSVHSPFRQLQIDFKFTSLFAEQRNYALLRKNKQEKHNYAKDCISYKGAFYYKGIPIYYSSLPDGPKPTKLWWTNTWFMSLADQIEPVLFERLKSWRQKRLSDLEN